MQNPTQEHIKHPQKALYTQVTEPDSCLSNDEWLEKIKSHMIASGAIRKKLSEDAYYDKIQQKLLPIVEMLYTKNRNKKIQIQVNIKNVIATAAPVDTSLKTFGERVQVQRVKVSIKTIKSKTPLKYISIKFKNQEQWKFTGINFLAGVGKKQI